MKWKAPGQSCWELSGGVQRCFSNLFFEDRQNLVQNPDFTCPPVVVVGWSAVEMRRAGRKLGRCRAGCRVGVPMRSGGVGGREWGGKAESCAERPAELGADCGAATSARVSEQWSPGKRSGGAEGGRARRGRGCMGRREASADRIGGEQREAQERARRASGRGGKG